MQGSHVGSLRPAVLRVTLYSSRATSDTAKPCCLVLSGVRDSQYPSIVTWGLCQLTGDTFSSDTVTRLSHVNADGVHARHEISIDFLLDHSSYKELTLTQFEPLKSEAECYGSPAVAARDQTDQRNATDLIIKRNALAHFKPLCTIGSG
eukprot:750569-Hanusia_phi.AAC.2